MAVSDDFSKIPAPPGAHAAHPTALTVAQLAKLLGLTAEKVQADLAAGAPMNADGTIHLLHYTAWLVREVGHGD